MCFCRAAEDLRIMTPVPAYTPELPASSISEPAQHLCIQEATPTHSFDRTLATFPPSFTSLLTSHCPNVEQGKRISPFYNIIVFYVPLLWFVILGWMMFSSSKSSCIWGKWFQGATHGIFLIYLFGFLVLKDVLVLGLIPFVTIIKMCFWRCTLFIQTVNYPYICSHLLILIFDALQKYLVDSSFHGT